MRRGRFRWFEKVKRKLVDVWVSACRTVEIASRRGRGKLKKAHLDGDMKDMGLRPEMAMDREKWRCGIMGRTSYVLIVTHKCGNNGR